METILVNTILPDPPKELEIYDLVIARCGKHETEARVISIRCDGSIIVRGTGLNTRSPFWGMTWICQESDIKRALV